MTWYEWDRRNEPHNWLFRRNYQNYNGYRNYIGFQNYKGYRDRLRTPNRYGGVNGPNFSRNHTPNFWGQGFNRNINTQYRNQNKTYFNGNSSQSC